MSVSFHAWMTAIGFVIFTLVWAGLATNIVQIARRDRNPPRFDALLNGAHVARFAGWALVGAATLRIDPLTALLLMSTRIPAVALVMITFLQRKDCRPSRVAIFRRVFFGGSPLLLACGLIAWGTPHLPAARFEFFATSFESPNALHLVLIAGVGFAFAVQLFYGLPRQILRAREAPLGNLRWFQGGLLVNYGFTFAYASLVADPLTSGLMVSAYGLAFLEQLALVVIIERGVRRHRTTQALAGAA